MACIQVDSFVSAVMPPSPPPAQAEGAESLTMRYLSRASQSWGLTRESSPSASATTSTTPPALPSTTVAVPSAPAAPPDPVPPGGSVYNPNPDGVDLLVIDQFDISPEEAAAGAIASHGDQVSYVAASSIQADIEVNGLQVEELNMLVKQLRDIAESPNPPEVINISMGADACAIFKSDLQDYQDRFKKKYGEDSTQWDEEIWAKYKDDIGWVASAAVSYFYDQVGDIPDRLKEVLQQLVDADVTVVVSAGNEGEVKKYLDFMGVSIQPRLFDGLFLPDLPDGVIMVGGATRGDRAGVAADFASPRGEIDVAADGVDVRVSDRGDVNSGSSFAAPQVAALAADLKAKDPTLTPAQIEAIIKRTVHEQTDEDPEHMGVGIIDPAAALADMGADGTIFHT